MSKNAHTSTPYVKSMGVDAAYTPMDGRNKMKDLNGTMILVKKDSVIIDDSVGAYVEKAFEFGYPIFDVHPDAGIDDAINTVKNNIKKYGHDYLCCVEGCIWGKAHKDATANNFKTITLEDLQEPKELIYTQEMWENKVVPGVGMKFVVNSKNGRTGEFDGFIVEVVSVSVVKGVSVITFYHATSGVSRGVGCAFFSTDWVKPIDTRTPEQKQDDEIVNLMDGKELDARHSYNHFIQLLRKNGHLVNPE